MFFRDLLSSKKNKPPNIGGRRPVTNAPPPCSPSTLSSRCGCHPSPLHFNSVAHDSRFYCIPLDPDVPLRLLP